MIKFMAVDFYNTTGIVAVEVERETETCVWIGGHRSNKRSDYYNYFDTWEEARDFFLERAERAVEDCRRRFESAKESLETIRGLKRPE